jgi:hypothetical protein
VVRRPPAADSGLRPADRAQRDFGEVGHPRSRAAQGTKGYVRGSCCSSGAAMLAESRKPVQWGPARRREMRGRPPPGAGNCGHFQTHPLMSAGWLGVVAFLVRPPLWAWPDAGGQVSPLGPLDSRAHRLPPGVRIHAVPRRIGVVARGAAPMRRLATAGTGSRGTGLPTLRDVCSSRKGEAMGASLRIANRRQRRLVRPAALAPAAWYRQRYRRVHSADATVAKARRRSRAGAQLGDRPTVPLGEVEPEEDLPHSQHGAFGPLRRDRDKTRAFL